MTNPFASFVGLRGIATDVPVWVNDLPGMSSELINAVRKDDQSAAETWQRINRLAMTKLRSMLENEFNRSGEFVHTVATTSVWSQKDVTDTVVSPAKLQGQRFTVPYSPYRQLIIQSLNANVASSGPVTLPVKIIDLKQGVLLEEREVVRKGGYGSYSPLGIKIPVDMYGLDVFVGVDASALTLVEMGGAAVSMTGNCGTMTTGEQVASNPTAAGFTATDTRVWIAATVSNSLDAIIEGYASDLADTYAHLVAASLLTDKLASNRINLYTNTNREYTEELEVKTSDEAKTLLKPLARRILTDLNAAPAAIVVADPDDQPGYYPISLV
ncbi:hypothetical protein A6C57_23340 [Fibrella sp. ES10-3-2-2]|nr:hypothetical protein A6C57_23340 [Fibrella sp. ES10-3-2-2]